MILSINVAQLPWLYNQMPDPDDRMAAICNNILAAINDPTSVGIRIICFQELFSNSARHIVRKMLKSHYPYMFLDNSCGKYGIGVNSGLGIISRDPLTCCTIREYSSRRNIEYLTKKGLMGVKCTWRLPNLSTITLYIYNTHLQAGGNIPPFSWLNRTSADEIKHRQIREAMQWIRRDLSASDPHSIILFCGDLNLSPDEDPFTNIRPAFPLVRDTFDSMISPISYSSANRKRIDYCIELRPQPEVEVLSIIIDESMVNTDHHPVMVSIM